MIQLADRLRHSSDDLTHFARTYCVTGKTEFKNQYFEVLSIRNGESLRPKNYFSVYWDLKKEIREEIHPLEQAISLKDLMSQLPYSKEEIQLLTLSEKNSNKLVNLEKKAFYLMDLKSKYEKQNNFKLAYENHQLAIKLLHSEDYYNAKNIIMKPIDEFITLLDERTKNESLELKKQIDMHYFILKLLATVFILANMFIFTFLNRKDEEIKLKLIKENQNQLQKIRENDILILQQAKMASMGEMIGNIAHQWRQPLSAITTVASAIKVHEQLGTLTKNDIHNDMDKIILKANFLSDTISTFRNFLNTNNKNISKIDLNQILSNSINLVSASLKDNQIKIINNINKTNQCFIFGIENEFLQVVINILNNSKDAFIEKQIDNAWVKVDLEKHKDSIIIYIEDNAGGIPNDILNKIFEPYFTTKHQSQGTGLGLHMSYKIITESFKGKIFASNTKNGARFTLQLPAYHS